MAKGLKQNVVNIFNIIKNNSILLYININTLILYPNPNIHKNK